MKENKPKKFEYKCKCGYILIIETDLNKIKLNQSCPNCNKKLEGENG